LLLNTALPVLVGVTLAFHDPVVVGGTSIEMTTLGYKSIGWAGRVDENTKRNSGGGDENIEESHFDQGRRRLFFSTN
jgi:hypothetical protein